jgi:hypothetical protein
MNVHITCTPEFSFEKLEEIVSLLKSIPGELKFIIGKPSTQEWYRRHNRKFEDINQISSLSFEEYFDLVQDYRGQREIDDNDFVILISSIRNQKNYFSAFDKKNIFIHGDEWNLISDVDSKFEIAYQCVENIFQSLIDLNIHDFHQEAIGCINDFCGYKPDILRKLQSANICLPCYERSVKKGINDLIMTHIISIMEKIRDEFVISKRFSRQANLEKVKIDHKGKITIGDKIIKMDLLPRVMYICFLKNINGFPTEQLCENKDKFEKIYRLIKKNPDELAIIKMCCNKISYSNSIERRKPTFEQYRSKIKIALTQKLGLILTNYYHVNLVEDQNHQNIFKVNLTPENLEIDVSFIN